MNDIYTYAKMDEGNDDEWMTVTNSEGGEEKIIEPGIYTKPIQNLIPQICY